MSNRLTLTLIGWMERYMSEFLTHLFGFTDLTFLPKFMKTSFGYPPN